MFTPDERRALVFLAAVAAAGGLVRVVRSRSAAPGAAPGAALVVPEIRGGDVARQAALARRAAELARPLRPGERVDIDRASAEELERLPRVGPGLARRIAADREAHGPFGSPEGLARVPGLGPGMLRTLEGSVSFSGVPRAGREPATGYRQPAREPADGNRSSVPRVFGSRSTVATPVAGSRLPVAASSCAPTPIALNTATAEQLVCLPGIGPSLAARIVTFRTAHGPFREVKDLQQVPGIGPARMTRLAPLLHAP